jgi:hypothetical protein
MIGSSWRHARRRLDHLGGGSQDGLNRVDQLERSVGHCSGEKHVAAFAILTEIRQLIANAAENLIRLAGQMDLAHMFLPVFAHSHGRPPI